MSSYPSYLDSPVWHPLTQTSFPAGFLTAEHYSLIHRATRRHRERDIKSDFVIFFLCIMSNVINVFSAQLAELAEKNMAEIGRKKKTYNLLFVNIRWKILGQHGTVLQKNFGNCL